MNKIQSILVKDLEGKLVNLSELYANKNLLIIIYNNACLGCTGRALPFAYELQQAYPNIKVLGIHANFGIEKTSKIDIESIFTSGKTPFPIYIDEGHKVYDQFHSEGTPQWLIITKENELYRSVFGSQANAQNRLYYALDEIL